MTTQDLARKLKTKRMAEGLSQVQVAKATGLSAAAIAKFENGSTESPRPSTFNRIHEWVNGSEPRKRNGSIPVSGSMAGGGALSAVKAILETNSLSAEDRVALALMVIH